MFKPVTKDVHFGSILFGFCPHIVLDEVEIYDQPVDKEDYWMEYLCVNDSRDDLY